MTFCLLQFYASCPGYHKFYTLSIWKVYVRTHIISVIAQIFSKSFCLHFGTTNIVHIFLFCFKQRIIHLRAGHEISLQCLHFGFRFNCTAIPLLFHTVSAAKDALITSQDELLSSVLTHVCFLHYHPLCHNCFHLAIIFKLMTPKILHEWWKKDDNSFKPNALDESQ